jgi:hypothetical protein
MQQMDRTPEQLEPREAEPSDERVVRLMPRQRPLPEPIPDPPDDNDDDDDPGPAAA